MSGSPSAPKRAIYPVSTSRAATAVMKANRRVNTKPERDIRTLLHRMGFRYRVDFPIVASGVRTRPDIVFTRARTAVFIDGCFWHACPTHGQIPVSNRTYWSVKLRYNQARDATVNEALTSDGWLVLRHWEHEPCQTVAAAIARCVRLARRPPV